jgi:uracil-DNA glycosylase
MLYDLLPKVGVADAHLTDLYKRRGKSGSLRTEIPRDFKAHIEFFRAELKLLDPTIVVALGDHAYELLEENVPEVRPILRKMWHFAYVTRYRKGALYEANMRLAFSPV